jgi:hypothetical protein
MRAAVGAGSRNGDAFQEISYRPAYHSLTDNDYGLLPGASINFLNMRVRYYDSSHKTVLSKFDLLEIRSLSPVNQLFAPTSFGLGVNVERELMPDTKKEGYVLNLSARGGATVAPYDNLWFYFLGSTYGNYGGFLPHNQYIGSGFALGAYINFRYFKLLGEAEKVFATTWYGNKIKYKLEAAIPLSANFAIAAEYRYEDNKKGKDLEEYITSIRWYF